MIDLQAFPDRCLPVIFPLYKRLSTDVINTGLLRRIEQDMINPSRPGMNAAAVQAFDNLVIRYHDLNHTVDQYAFPLHCLGLAKRPRETVEQVTLPAIIPANPVLDQVHDQVIRYQFSGFHYLFCLKPQRSAGPDRSAQHVAGRNLGYVKLVFNESGLRALTGARRS